MLPNEVTDAELTLRHVVRCIKCGHDFTPKPGVPGAGHLPTPAPLPGVSGFEPTPPKITLPRSAVAPRAAPTVAPKPSPIASPAPSSPKPDRIVSPAPSDAGQSDEAAAAKEEDLEVVEEQEFDVVEVGTEDTHSGADVAEASGPTDSFSHPQPPAPPPPDPEGGPVTTPELRLPQQLAPEEASTDRRRYYRIPSVVPVDFQIVSKSRGAPDPEIRRAVTTDLSGHGLCLKIASLPPTLTLHLQAQALDDLVIHMDLVLPKRSLRIPGRLAWAREAVPPPSGYVIGVEFIDIEPDDASAIVGFAKRAARRPKIYKVIVAVLLLVIIAGAALYGRSQATHQEALESASRELEATNRAYQELADELETQNQQFEDLSTRVKAFVELMAQDPAADPGTEAPDMGGTAKVAGGHDDAAVAVQRASAVSDLVAAFEQLQSTTVRLNEKVETFAGATVPEALEKRKAKRRGKKMKGRKRRKPR